MLLNYEVTFYCSFYWVLVLRLNVDLGEVWQATFSLEKLTVVFSKD